MSDASPPHIIHDKSDGPPMPSHFDLLADESMNIIKSLQGRRELQRAVPDGMTLRSRVEFPDDGYTWRKYGHKSCPRTTFYRCSQSEGTGCRAMKKVADGDDSVFLVTYKEFHTCRSGGPEKEHWPFAPPSISTPPAHGGSPDKPALCQATSVTRSDFLPSTCSPSLSVLPAAGGFPVSNLADQSNGDRALLANCPAVPECGCDQLHHTSLPGTPSACSPGDSSSTLFKKQRKAGSGSVDIGGSLTSMETEELEVLNECMENASEDSDLSGDSSSTLFKKRRNAGSGSVDIGASLTSMETEELEVLNECMENASEDSDLSGASIPTWFNMVPKAESRLGELAYTNSRRIAARQLNLPCASIPTWFNMVPKAESRLGESAFRISQGIASRKLNLPCHSRPTPSQMGLLYKPQKVLSRRHDLVSKDLGENASEKLYPSGAKFVQFSGPQSVKDLKEECSKSDGQSSISKEIGSSVHMPLPLATFDASRLEPIEKLDGNRLLLRLENTQLGQSISVGVVIHSEVLEFYFFDTTDMAICVGVGLHQAKVVLHNDLSIIIEETSISDREVLDTWKPFLSDKSSHVVMKAEWGVEGMCQDCHVETFNTRDGESLLWLCGVGFGGNSRYVDETYDAREVSWPLLYDMALITLAANTPQCNETTGESSAGGSTSLQENIQSNLADKLHGKRKNVFSHGNIQDGGGSSDGDGDEDRFAYNSNALEDDEPPVVLKVTVRPLTKHEILDTQVKPYGLDRASIAPELIFEFRKNHKCKRISIKTRTRLELASQVEVFCNGNLFGWYHTGIQISFGCVDTEGHPQNGRVALLRQNSCKILNPRTSYKYTIAKSIVSSEANTYTSGGEAGLKLSNALLGGIALHGSSSGSNMQQVERSNGEQIETTRESVCGGFSFRDHSSTESPARASFLLFYPLQGMNIWGDKQFLEGEGLFSTIEPSIEGTWIPLNGLDASPYLFKAARSLKFHARVSGCDDQVLNYKQEYVLPFYVNHAMSHLRSQRNKHIELSSDQQRIPNVLMVGSVF